MRARFCAGLAFAACLALLIATSPGGGAVATTPSASAVATRATEWIGPPDPSPTDTTADDVEVHLLAQEGRGDAPYVFAPDVLTIPIGTTVRWYNHTGAYHTVTTSDSLTVEQPNGLIQQTLLEAGATAAHTFTAPGMYFYYCEPHADFMKGTIIVTGG